MLVRRQRGRLGDLPLSQVEEGFAHLPQGLLQRARLHRGEPFEQHIAARLHTGAPSPTAPSPSRCRRSASARPATWRAAVSRLGEGRVLVVEKAAELRSRRFQQGRSRRPDTTDRPVGLDGDGRRAGLGAASHPGMVVLARPDQMRSDAYSSMSTMAPCTGSMSSTKWRPSSIAKSSISPTPFFFAQREAGVLLGIGRQHIGLIADDVRVGEVTAQRRRDIMSRSS